MKKLKLTFLFSSMAVATSFAQPKPYGPQPTIGKPMPDFTLKNITHYKETNASLADFKGKWLFLDFWFQECISCIKSFPKSSQLQKEFGENIQFMLIAAVDDTPGGYSGIESTKALFEKLTVTNELNLPCVYDSILPYKWGIYSMPHIIVVDPKGEVNSIISGRDLTSEKIKSLINTGKADLFPSRSTRLEFKVGVDHESPSDADSLILFQSTLAKYNNENFERAPLDVQCSQDIFLRKGYQLAGMPLYMIYNMAYFSEPNWTRYSSLYNNVYPLPILEIKNDSLFKWKDANNYKKGMYNYKITVPQGTMPTKERVMQIMQNDLKNYFGYEVKIERRKMPYYSLVVRPSALEKLKNKGSSKYFKSENQGAFGFTAVRYNMDIIMGFITRYLPKVYTIPFLDETGIVGTIDLEIKTDMSNMEQVKQELNKNGLDLVLKNKEFTVLVLRDPKSDNYITENSFSYRSKILTHIDSVNINQIIYKYVSPNKSTDWVKLSSTLKDSYPEIANEIVLKTQVAYYLDRENILNFEKAIMEYSTRFFFSIPKDKLVEYAEFLANKSFNEDVLSLADQWRLTYLQNDDMAHEWYVSAKILYKLGHLQKTNRKGANIAGGKGNIRSAINYMKTKALKIEPNNKLYQETLVKMEKGEPIW